MKLDERTLRLIAIGASISANCQPCLQINLAEALKNGAQDNEIAEAIQVGKMVRSGAASKMDKFILTLQNIQPPSPVPTDVECGCGA
jgi:AhpD family alkylhydroperoxidase